MYYVELEDLILMEKIEIQNEDKKLRTGNIVKGINTIDSFSFSCNMNSLAREFAKEMQTLVYVYHDQNAKPDFSGRILRSKDDMDEDGHISKEFICESFLGFLCDTVQDYVPERNWMVNELVNHILNTHNSMVESHKRFKIGQITAVEPTSNVYIGIQRENTWKTIQEKLIKKFGGEISYRIEDDGIYLDWLKEVGIRTGTFIELSKNMKKITKEVDPTEYISRLIPLGAKLKDEAGDETEFRLGIEEVNESGLNYIESAEGVEKYGIKYEVKVFDKITQAQNLKNAAIEYLANKNKIAVRYSIDALNLHLLNQEYDDYEVGNYYRIKNDLIGIREEARVIKKKINIVDELKSTMEFGDNFKLLSDMQNDNFDEIKKEVEILNQNYVSKEVVDQLKIQNASNIEQSENYILSEVSKNYYTQGKTDELINSLSTQFIQNAQGFDLRFNELKKELDKANGTIVEQNKYIRFINGEIVIGIEGCPLTAVHTNTSLEFKYNGVTVGKFTNEGLYTRNVNVENRISLFGKWSIGPGTNGDLNIKWIGGN